VEHGAHLPAGWGTSSPSVLVDGFEAGYVWAESQATDSSTPNTRRPLKDGYYDHAQNCLEYIVLAFGPTAERKPKRTVYEPPRVYRGHDSWMAWRPARSAALEGSAFRSAG
jgi:hypothetical protein